MSIYCAPTYPSVKAKPQVCLYASWGHLILKMQHSKTRQQRWDRMRITGVDSGRILRFSFGPGTRTGSQKFGKNRTRSHFSISAVAGVCVVNS